jgi:hypothetical protein
LAADLETVRASDLDRERVARVLRDHTAAGRLTLEEFSQRLDEAYAARTVAELDTVTRELPVRQASPARRRPLRLALAVFGHVVRRGLLRLGRSSLAVSVLGDLDLDVRNASLGHEHATVYVLAVVGNVDVYVPEGIDVDAGGITLGGHCRDWGRVESDEGSPRLRVRVLTLFGTADVWRIPPGASGTYRELIKGLRAERRELPPGRPSSAGTMRP